MDQLFSPPFLSPEQKTRFLEEKLREEHLKVVQERDLAEYFKAQLQSLREQFKVASYYCRHTLQGSHSSTIRIPTQVRVQSKAGGLGYKLAENRSEKGLRLINDLRHLHDVNVKLEKQVGGLKVVFPI